MSANEVMILVAAILTTALETEPAFFPESHAYLVCGSDMSKWDVIRKVLTGGASKEPFVTIEGHVIRLTPAGRDLAQKIETARKG